MKPFSWGRKSTSMHTYLFYGVCALVLILLIAVILLGIGRSQKSSSLDSTRDALANAEREQLEAMFAQHDTIGYPNADPLGDVLPSMNLYFHTAVTLDGLLAEEYGLEYKLLNDDVTRFVELTMQELVNALTQGQDPSQSYENLGTYVIMLRDSLTTRFLPGGELIPVAVAE